MIREWNRARCKVQRNEWKQQQHNYFLFKIEILSIIFFLLNYTYDTRHTTQNVGRARFRWVARKKCHNNSKHFFLKHKEKASIESFAMNDDESTASNRQKYKIIILMNYLHICSSHPWKVHDHDTRRDIFYFFFLSFHLFFIFFRRSFTIFNFLYNTPPARKHSIDKQND